MKHQLKMVMAAISLGLAVTSTNSLAEGVYIDLKPALEKAGAVEKIKRAIREAAGTDRHEVIIHSAGVTLQGGNTVPGNFHLWGKTEEAWWWVDPAYGISTNVGITFEIGPGCNIQNIHLRKWGTERIGAFGFIAKSVVSAVFKILRDDWEDDIRKGLQKELKGKVPGC